MNPLFSLHRFLFLLLAAICCLFTPISFADSAGSITRLSGENSILAANGNVRVAAKGTVLFQGDTAITGKNGKMEIRFSDDSIVQLPPLSQFRINEYAYGGKKDTHAKSFFSLLKGGMRTITGLIGKLNRPGYAVAAESATIGIRGTEYSAYLKDGLHVTVERGEISLTNRAGSFAVSEGQGAYIPNQNSAPQYQQSAGISLNGENQTSSGGGSGKIQIHGNTRIDASTSNTEAIAVGQGNSAVNQAGVIGGH